MCESVSSIPTLITPNSLLKSPNSKSLNKYSFANPRNAASHFITACFKSNGSQINSIKFDKSSIPSFDNELGFKEIERIGRKTERKREKVGKKNDDDEERDFATSSYIAGLDDEREVKGPVKDDDELGLKLEELDRKNGGLVSERRRGKQLIKRSNLIAKQVISIQSALSLGFISQLWVDTLSWVVLVIEVRPNLLSGEIERFFLEDVRQVGDVVLIQDESVLENDLQMAGLDTLVGYDVITPGRQTIGKVRGYTFNINSGVVESLELDSFGISIIPSSLVSSYALLVEDVLEVISDTVVVHEAAVLRIQRLTKGFWGSPKLGRSIDELEDSPDDFERPPIRLDKGRRKRRTSSSQKFVPRKGADLDDWELPKDYL